MNKHFLYSTEMYYSKAIITHFRYIILLYQFSFIYILCYNYFGDIMLEKAQEIYDSVKDIKYGWMDKNNKFHFHISEGFVKNFKFQSPKELSKSRIGMCWETVELSKYLLKKNGIPCKTFFFVIPWDNFYCHSVLVFEANNKFYWFENSLKQLLGIWEFNSLQELFNSVLDNYKYISNRENVNLKLIKIFEYNSPKKEIGCVRFYMHCFKSKKMPQSYLENYFKMRNIS